MRKKFAATFNNVTGKLLNVEADFPMCSGIVKRKG